MRDPDVDGRTPRAPPRFLTRRALLRGGLAAAVGGSAYAVGVEPRWLDVSEHDIAVPGLTPALSGLRIAQLTDVHLTSLGMLERKVIAAVRAHRPQIVVLSGDVVDSESAFGALRELVGELARSGAAVLATLGNWEHWGNVPVDALARVYSAAGARLLVNEAVRVHGLHVLGTDDALAGQPKLRAAEGMAAREASLLVTHSPGFLDRSTPNFRFSLCVAGHTHGGQGRIGSFAPLVPPGSGRFVSGRYDTPLGAAYVSRGIGTSVLPARIGARPELPIFRLVQG
ncbi:MAG: metallophosphoesterase [Polyangiaceae bacterium]